MFVTHLRCTACPGSAEAEALQRVCPRCGAPLEVRYDLEAAGRALRREDLVRRRGGVWRFREVLPLPAGGEPVTLGEGGTPIFSVPRLGRRLGVERLLVKDEALNPTASFKARGMSVAVSMARHLGVTALAAPSAGNAGGALAAYGARAGLPVVVAMPRDVPETNRLEALACGARVELIDGTIADCGRWIASRCEQNGWFDLSTLKEPYRVEGKKTMGYEIAEALGWRLPEVILYPTGGGTGLVGMAKAFREMEELGWLDRDSPRPRLIAVQASGCAPIARAFRDGRDRAEFPERPSTVASGLRVPRPIGDRWMLRVIRESGGSAVAVTDAELLAGTFELARAEGLFTAPEGGALVAALSKFLDGGEIRSGEQTLLLLTGSGLKYREAFELDG